MRMTAMTAHIRVLALLTVLPWLSGCNPCDYQVDAWSPTRARVEVLAPSPAELERLKRASEEAYRTGTPEYRARLDAARNLASEQSARAETAPTTNDPYVRFRRATLTECAIDHSAQAFAWLLLPLLALGTLEWLSRRLTGHSMIAWLTGGRS